MTKRKGLWASLADFFQGSMQSVGMVTKEAPPHLHPEPVTRRIALVVHNPRVPKAGNQRLSDALNWHNPRDLVQTVIDDLRECSHGYAKYQIVEEIDVDRFPRKADGFTYKADQFVSMWNAKAGFHDPDGVDYDALLEEFDMVRHVNDGHIDEFWLYAFPYAGYYESIMGGPRAFWCNAPPLKQTARCDRRFVIMGFNYQRGVGEALEAYGHRAESIMKHVFRRHRGKDNLWERFIRHEHDDPGRAEVGWMHYAPNSEHDYDWGNTRYVTSRWPTWQSFPNLDGEAVRCNCSDWGNGDIRAHHKWWFKLLPHVTGETRGIAHNWWQYIVDPNLAR